MSYPLRPLALALACLCASASHAQHISRLYTLGDSLSDAGTYAPSTELMVPGSGRFTTNPGQVWVEYLGDALGLPSDPAIVNQGGMPTRTATGGSNYAQGGSRVNENPGVGVGSGPWYTADPVSSQVDRLLADTGSRIDAHALTMVWAGANDVLTQYGAMGGGLSLATAVVNAQTAAHDLSAQVARLQAAGARLIVINTLPDIGNTPFGASQGSAGAAALSQLTQAFNAQLLQETAGRNVLVFDSNRLFSDVLARPAAYGFTAPAAATVPACATPSSLICTNAAMAATTVFADGVHPTSAAHAALAQAALSVLYAPSQNGTLAVAPLVAMRQHAQNLESRLSISALAGRQADGSLAARPVGDIQLVADVQAGRFQASSVGVQLGNDGSTRVSSLAADMQILPNALAGVALSYASGRVDFSGGTGHFGNRVTTAGVYSTVALSPQWYVNAALGWGQLDYDRIQRDARLGSTALLISSLGSTSGSYRQARVGGGYTMRTGAFVGGASLSLTHESIKVDGYSETTGPLSLVFGDTRYTARRLSLGVAGALDLPRVQPFARASIERDLNNAPMRMSLGSYASNMMTVEGERPDTRFMLATLGVRGELTRSMHWSLAVNATLGQRDVRGRALAASLRVAL